MVLMEQNENPAGNPAPAPAQTAEKMDSTPALAAEAEADAADVDWSDPEAIARLLDEGDQAKGEAGRGQPKTDPGKAAEDGQKQEAGQGGQQEADAPPESWNVRAKEAWAKLSPEIRAEVRRVEAERNQFVAGEVRERRRAAEISQAVYEYARTELDQAILASEAALDGEFGGLDWDALRRDDPEKALQLEGLRSRRRAGLQAVMEQRRQLARAGESHRLREHGRYLLGQLEDAKNRLKAVAGEEVTPKAWKAEAVKYLTGQGVPPEHIAGLAHGYQIEILAKAMKYDQLMGAAQAAENKLAAAPKVMPPKAGPAGPGAGGGRSGMREAMARLNQDPYSNENIAAVLARA
jgi:hypothetical protein